MKDVLHDLESWCRYQADWARVCVFCAPSVLEMVSVSAVVGSVVGDFTDMRCPVDFSSVLLNDISLLAQVRMFSVFWFLILIITISCDAYIELSCLTFI